MTVVWALWIITSTYSTQMAAYPSPAACAAVAIDIDAALKSPTAINAKIICLPLIGAAPVVDDAPRFGI